MNANPCISESINNEEKYEEKQSLSASQLENNIMAFKLNNFNDPFPTEINDDKHLKGYTIQFQPKYFDVPFSTELKVFSQKDKSLEDKSFSFQPNYFGTPFPKEGNDFYGSNSNSPINPKKKIDDKDEIHSIKKNDQKPILIKPKNVYYSSEQNKEIKKPTKIKEKSQPETKRVIQLIEKKEEEEAMILLKQGDIQNISQIIKESNVVQLL